MNIINIKLEDLLIRHSVYLIVAATFQESNRDVSSSSITDSVFM